MMKFLLGVLCGLILAGMTVFVLFFAALRLGDRRPAIADGSTLVWRPEGEVPERPAMEFPIPGIGNQPSLTVRDTWSMLRHAATDSRIRAVVFEPSGVDGGGEGVKLAQVVTDQSEFKLEYQPGNPAADKNGYVKLPNVDPLVEALDMREAQRAYEANLNVIENARSMQMRTLDLLKQ